MTRIATGRGCGEAGFTLSEMTVSVLISFVVLSAAYLLLETATRFSDAVYARSVAAEETRLAIDLMGREVRQAELVGGVAFPIWGARDFAFYSDVDRDNVPEKVRYYVDVSGRKLARTVSEALTVPPTSDGAFGTASAPRVLANGLRIPGTEPVFTYFALSNATAQSVLATGAPTISSIRVHLHNEATAGRSTASEEVTSQIRVRSVNSDLED